MGRLTTHVLDTAHGRPAAGMAAALYGLAGAERTLITSLVMNRDGRADGPILDGDGFRPGVYELEFQAGDYFRDLGLALDEPAFLDVVVLRFGVAADEHYHVPLLVSPFSYSTYRGS